MAKIKICLDPGHYGKYNRSPVDKRYYESEMNWKLHLYLKAELEAYGFKVITTKKTQAENPDVYERGKKAKGCSLFLSVHSNAAKTNEPDYAVACCQIDDDKTKIDDISESIGRKLAPAVNKLMGSKGEWQIYEKMGNYNADYYGVLRGAKAVGVPGVLMEHGFHTNKANTLWLLDDNNLKKLAKEEAKILAQYFGLKKTTTTTTTTPTKKTIYYVRKSWNDTKSQLGAFSVLANAKAMVNKNKQYKVFDNTGKVVYSVKSETTPKVTYFPKYTGKTVSIVSALNSLKITSTYAYRTKIAKANNISLYVGTASQNTKMLNLLKQGKLIKP